MRLSLPGTSLVLPSLESCLDTLRVRAQATDGVRDHELLADTYEIACEAVHLAQDRGCSPVTLRELTKRLPATNLMPGPLDPVAPWPTEIPDR